MTWDALRQKGFYRPHRSGGWKCPICGRPDWCLASSTEPVVVCARVPWNLNEPYRRQFGEAGWVHDVGDIIRVRAEPHIERRQEIDWYGLDKEFNHALAPWDLESLADRLGVPDYCLMHLGVGLDPLSKAKSFPMRDQNRNIVGFRLRTDQGRKFAIRGSQSGPITGAEPLPTEWVLLPEGPTDAAAGLALDMDVIARPAAKGSTKTIIAMAKELPDRQYVVVLDRDKPDRFGRRAGYEGGMELARAMSASGLHARTIMPPEGIKDLRQWYQQGLTSSKIRLLAGARKRVMA